MATAKHLVFLLSQENYIILKWIRTRRDLNLSCYLGFWPYKIAQQNF